MNHEDDNADALGLQVYEEYLRCGLKCIKIRATLGYLGSQGMMLWGPKDDAQGLPPLTTASKTSAVRSFLI